MGDEERLSIAWAVRAKDIEQVRARLDQGRDPYYRDCRDCLPMTWAAKFGYLDIVKLLIERGVDPNRDGSALASAAMAGQLEVIRYLITIGQDPHARYDQKMSALEWAKLVRRGKAVAVLQGLSADDVEDDDDDEQYSIIYPQTPVDADLKEAAFRALLTEGNPTKVFSLKNEISFKPARAGWVAQVDIRIGDKADELTMLVRDLICFLLKNEQEIYETLLEWYTTRLAKEWKFGDYDPRLPYFTVKVESIADLVQVIGGRWNIYASLSIDGKPRLSLDLPCRIDGEHDVHVSFGKRKLIKAIWIE